MRNLLNPGVYVLGFRSSSTVNNAFGEKIAINGSDISPSSSLTKEVLTRGMSSAGNVTQLNYKWELNLQFADSYAYGKLAGLPKTQTTALEIWKTNGFVTWREEVDVFVDEAHINDPESEDYPYTARMIFIGPDPFIKESINYLAPWEGLQARQWSLTGDFATATFDGTIQAIETLSAGTVLGKTDVWTPFRDGDNDLTVAPKIAVYANINVLPANGDLYFEYRGKAATGADSGPGTSTLITSTGNQLLGTITIASGWAGVTVGFKIDNIVAATRFELSNPYIVRDRDDGLTASLNEYINY